MTRVVAIVAVVVAAAGVAREVPRWNQPVIPPIVTPSMNAARAIEPGVVQRLASSLDARMPLAARPKLVALTFDDGPYPVETPLLLATLRRLDVPATFFLIGRDALQFPELTARIAADGHEIANHTMTHPDLDAMDSAHVRRELDDGAGALDTIVRDPSIRTIMRPPHGRFTLQTVEAAQRDGYNVVLWSEDPGDWRAVPAATLAKRVIDAAVAPDILLLHSGRLPTIEMLPEIVGRFRRAGFTFVTVRQLMARVPLAEIEKPVRTAI